MVVNNKPLVSVCMITYNHELFIKQAIEGVLMQQTNFEIEFIIADDCSTDQTASVIRELIKNPPVNYNIKYVRHEKNIGMMPNFIFALEQCKGDYIALCEGDDYWTNPLKLQKQVDFLVNFKEYSVCFHPCYTLNQKTQVLKKQAYNGINYEYNIKNLLSFWNIPTASMVFRKDTGLIIPNWFKKVASGDIALLMLFYEKGKFNLLQEYMSVYRINGSGVSNTHVNYRMIHYRTILYAYLNEFFDFKYEKDIYDALNYIYLQYSDNKATSESKRRLSEKLIKKIKNLLN